MRQSPPCCAMRDTIPIVGELREYSGVILLLKTSAKAGQLPSFAMILPYPSRCEIEALSCGATVGFTSGFFSACQPGG
jgi:hypothetical protein